LGRKGIDFRGLLIDVFGKTWAEDKIDLRIHRLPVFFP